MKAQIEVFPDSTILIERSIDFLVNKITTTLSTSPQCNIVLAGGNTPKPVYQGLSQQSLPWEKLHIFWGDERYVPSDHPDSNYRMAKEAWLDHVPIPAGNIHPMPTKANDPALDANTYENTIKSLFSPINDGFPQFDIILLGMGDDGHTASLFPHTESLKIDDRLVTVGEKNHEPRLTMTIPLINRAHCVLFLVTGANKQKALSEIWSPTGDNYTYPARFIQPIGELHWFFDHTAGKNFI
jgi:6-phosphogluconolactonase